MAHVAFIGLGNMGGPMAGNLLGAGHAVTVFDLVPEACAALAEQGAAVADSAQAAIEGAEYVVSAPPAVAGRALPSRPADRDGPHAQRRTASRISAEERRQGTSPGRHAITALLNTW